MLLMLRSKQSLAITIRAQSYECLLMKLIRRNDDAAARNLFASMRSCPSQCIE